MKFNYFAPTKVYFGPIDAEVLTTEIKKFGTKVLILTGGKATTDIAKKILPLIHNCEIKIVSGISTNPTDSYLQEIKNHIEMPDVIISIGGGSIHDSAKALSIILTHTGDVEQFTTDGEFGVTGITNKVVPVITIPTIFGTGAEVSPAALIRIENKKRVIYSQYIYPKATFINVIYATYSSKDLCTKTALDALVQGIESYVSTESQSFSEQFSISAIERILKNLITKESAYSVNALEQLALASIESLYAIGQSTVGAVHAISNPLSGIYNIHHGDAVGLLLPYVIDVNYSFAKEKYDRLQSLFESVLGNSFKSLHDAIIEFYIQAGFNYKSVSQYLNKQKIKGNLSQCISDSYNNDMLGNPRNLNDSLIQKILINALE